MRSLLLLGRYLHRTRSCGRRSCSRVLTNLDVFEKTSPHEGSESQEKVGAPDALSNVGVLSQAVCDEGLLLLVGRTVPLEEGRVVAHCLLPEVFSRDLPQGIEPYQLETHKLRQRLEGVLVSILECHPTLLLLSEDEGDCWELLDKLLDMPLEH